MKRFLLLTALVMVPASAQAGFSLKDITGNTTSTTEAAPVTKPAATSAPRRVKPPMPKQSLVILNERYVPEDIKQKYKMGDDYFEMTNDKKAVEPIVITAPNAKTDSKKKKTLEIISGPPPVIPSQDIAALPPAQMPQSMPEPVPLTSKPALVVEGKPPVPVAPLAPVIPVPVERIDTFRARQGELLKDVLKRWSDREQAEFIWTAAESPKVSKEFSYVGNFTDAVAGLMKQDSGALKMKFSDDIGPTPNMSESIPMASDDMRVPEKDVMAGESPKKWFATNGASLEAVFRAWAETEGATLIWQADNQFAVPKSFNEKGGFEDAVATVLTQYENKKVRPVGQLYKNPVSGEKVLVIKTDNAG